MTAPTMAPAPVDRASARELSDRVARLGNQWRIWGLEQAPGPHAARDALTKDVGRQLWALLTAPRTGQFQAAATAALQGYLDRWADATDQDEITRLAHLSTLVACLPGARAHIEGTPTR